MSEVLRAEMMPSQVQAPSERSPATSNALSAQKSCGGRLLTEPGKEIGVLNLSLYPFFL